MSAATCSGVGPSSSRNIKNDAPRYELFEGDAARGDRIDLAQPLGDEDWDLPGDPDPFGDNLIAPIYRFGVDPEGDYTTLLRDGRSLWRVDAKSHGAGVLTPLGRAPLDATLDVVANTSADRRLTLTTLRERPGQRGPCRHRRRPQPRRRVYAGVSTDPGHAGTVAIVDTHSGEKRYVEPPSGTAATLPSRSSGHTLMFHATDISSQPSGLIVACDVNALTCEIVAQVDDIQLTVMPRL